MIVYKNVVFDKTQCRQQLDELKNLFLNSPEIDETKGVDGGLQNIFKKRPMLLALMGRLFFSELATYWNQEVDVGDYRVDFVIANHDKSKVALIEFENAKENSLFVKKTSSKTSISYEWAPRFDHGYSQVIDWVYLNSQNHGEIEKCFKDKKLDPINFALVIGWNKHLQISDLQERFNFRRNETYVDKKNIYCNTFDALLEELEEKYYLQINNL